MQRVIADFYNQTLQRRGKVDVFSIVKFRPKTNGTVNTAGSRHPPATSRATSPGSPRPPSATGSTPPASPTIPAWSSVTSSKQVSRDGNVGVCICPLPDGSLDDGSVKMLKEVGEWMRINGAGIYGSKAWTRLGEGADGKLNVLPGGKIGRNQADHRFAPSDIRFTVGKDGNLYAYCMTVPATGTAVAHHVARHHGQRPRQAGQVRHTPRLHRHAHVEAGSRRPRRHLARHLRLQDRARLQNRNEIGRVWRGRSTRAAVWTLTNYRSSKGMLNVCRQTV